MHHTVCTDCGALWATQRSGRELGHSCSNFENIATKIDQDQPWLPFSEWIVASHVS